MSALVPVEYKKVRVLTSKQLADAYEVDNKIINNNFSRNKERYKEGKHYFLLEGEKLKEFKMTVPQNDESLLRVNKLYLWTERGALYHAKSIGTDKAWEVYDMLVETYFRAKNIQKTFDEMTELEVMMSQIDALKKVVGKMIEHEQITKELQKKQQELDTKFIEQQKNIDTINTIISVEEKETLRQKFNAAVKALAYKQQLPIGIAYNSIYKVIKNTLRIDVCSRALRRGKKPVDILEEDNLLEYALRVVNKKLNSV